MDGFIYRSAKALADSIRSREISSYEVVCAAIARIEHVNPQINALVQERFEAALDEARRADEQLMHGEIRGPLHGVPMTIKDAFDTAGVITSAGTKGRASYVPIKDATVVARLREAGAILLGKTNTSELTATGITDNFVYGRTNNPYDVTCTPGGSSGGAAALVATGGIPFDIGSDTGGSIRMPAHYCGIAGIKPTAGRVPRTGHIPSYEIGPIAGLMHIGPLARYVEDLILLLPIVSGMDYHDPDIAPVSIGNPSDVALAQLRVAYYRDNGIEAPTIDTKRTLDRVIGTLSTTGMTLVEDRPAGIEQSATLFGSLILADGGEWIRSILRMWGTDPNEMHPTIRWTQSDQVIGTLELTALLAELNIYRSQMLAFLQDYDAIICPASSAPAPKHDSPEGTDFSYAGAFNLTGWPAVVVRGGTSSEGLPIGVQVVARPWRDDVALAIAHYIETALGGWQPPGL